MKPISEREAANLTGKDRRTVAGRLAGVPFTEGAHGAKLYDSTHALPAILGTGGGQAEEQLAAALDREKANAGFAAFGRWFCEQVRATLAARAG